MRSRITATLQRLSFVYHSLPVRYTLFCLLPVDLNIPSTRQLGALLLQLIVISLHLHL